MIFHDLHDVGGHGKRKVVRPNAAPEFTQANAPGGLRDVSGAEAWELGALAALEDERLFDNDE